MSIEIETFFSVELRRGREEDARGVPAGGPRDERDPEQGQGGEIARSRHHRIHAPRRECAGERCLGLSKATIWIIYVQGGYLG